MVLMRCKCIPSITLTPQVLMSVSVLSQVLGFAAFFALVLKKVDQEEYGEPQIDESLRNTGIFVSSLPFQLHCFVQTNKNKSFTIFFSQMILTRCVQQEETAHAASISHHLPLTSRG